MKIIAILLLGCLLSSPIISLAMDLGPEPQEEGTDSEVEEIPVVDLDWNSMGEEEKQHWAVFNQFYNMPSEVNLVHESMVRIFELHGPNSRFRLGNLESDMLLELMKLKQISSVEDCSIQNIRARYQIDMWRIQHHANLLNYVRYQNRRIEKYCGDYLTKSVNEIINNLGSKRRKRINELRIIIGDEIFQERLTKGFSKFVARHDSGISKEHLPGTPEHFGLFVKRIQELYKTICEQMHEGLMPWVRVYRQLYILIGSYQESFRFFDFHTTKWIDNAMVCHEFLQLQNPSHINFGLLYQNYVKLKMGNPAQLYPI